MGIVRSGRRVLMLLRAPRAAAVVLLVGTLACDGDGGGGGCARAALVTGPGSGARAASFASEWSIKGGPRLRTHRQTTPSIRVAVVDAATEIPLAARASGLVYAGGVRADTLRPETLSDGEHFLISGALPSGQYTVRVTHPGYLPWEVANLDAGGSGGCTGPNVAELFAPLEPAGVGVGRMRLAPALSR